MTADKFQAEDFVLLSVFLCLAIWLCIGWLVRFLTRRRQGTGNPIADADVYLAYGLKAQAVELLKEALIANPDRADIAKKLDELQVK